MRQSTATNFFAKRITERPIPPSLTQPFHVDPPALIAQALGGREFFYETEARAIHRIGIFLGLGWRLPRYVQRPDGIDMVRVVTETPLRGSLTLRLLHCGDRPPEEAEEVLSVAHINYADLRATYEDTLHGA